MKYLLLVALFLSTQAFAWTEKEKLKNISLKSAVILKDYFQDRPSIEDIYEKFKELSEIENGLKNKLLEFYSSALANKNHELANQLNSVISEFDHKLGEDLSESFGTSDEFDTSNPKEDFYSSISYEDLNHHWFKDKLKSDVERMRDEKLRNYEKVSGLLKEELQRKKIEEFEKRNEGTRNPGNDPFLTDEQQRNRAALEEDLRKRPSEYYHLGARCISGCVESIKTGVDITKDFTVAGAFIGTLISANPLAGGAVGFGVGATVGGTSAAAGCYEACGDDSKQSDVQTTIEKTEIKRVYRTDGTIEETVTTTKTTTEPNVEEESELQSEEEVEASKESNNHHNKRRPDFNIDKDEYESLDSLGLSRIDIANYLFEENRRLNLKETESFQRKIESERLKEECRQENNMNLKRGVSLLDCNSKDIDLKNLGNEWMRKQNEGIVNIRQKMNAERKLEECRNFKNALGKKNFEVSCE